MKSMSYSEKIQIKSFGKSLNLFLVSDNQVNSYLKVIKLILKMKKDGYLDKFLINSRNFVNKNYKESIVVEKTMALYEGFNLYCD